LPFLVYVAQVLTKRLCLPINTAFKGNIRLSCRFDVDNIDALRLFDLERVRTEVAGILAGTVTPNEVRASRDKDPYEGEAAEFGDLPFPVYQSKQAKVAGGPKPSPSANLPGSEGGRDQSDNGEAQMVDPTGTRSVDSEVFKLLNDFLNETNY
jgi:hypothetical protein